MINLFGHERDPMLRSTIMVEDLVRADPHISAVGIVYEYILDVAYDAIEPNYKYDEDDMDKYMSSIIGSLKRLERDGKHFGDCTYSPTSCERCPHESNFRGGLLELHEWSQFFDTQGVSFADNLQMSIYIIAAYMQVIEYTKKAIASREYHHVHTHLEMYEMYTKLDEDQQAKFTQMAKRLISYYESFFIIASRCRDIN